MNRLVLRTAIYACQLVGLAGMVIVWPAACIGCRLEELAERQQRARVAQLRRELDEAQREAL